MTDELLAAILAPIIVIGGFVVCAMSREDWRAMLGAVAWLSGAAAVAAVVLLVRSAVSPLAFMLLGVGVTAILIGARSKA